MSTLPTPTSSTATSVPFQTQYATVTKLTSTTFPTWKLRIETLMGAYNLRRYILEKVTPPTDAALLEQHQTNNCVALNAIRSTIDDENLRVISSCVTAFEAYQALCKHHSDMVGISTATLFFELVNLRLTSDITITEHIHRFRTLHNKLKCNISLHEQLKISDQFIAALLLFSLPSEFGPLVQTTLITTAFDKIDINHLYKVIPVLNRMGPAASPPGRLYL